MSNKARQILKTAAMNFFLGAFALGLGAGPAIAAAADDPVYFRLAARHFNDSVDSLAGVAGGRDKLTARLLELRHDEGLPYVSIRAEKLLIELANEEDEGGPIGAALEADVAAAGSEGLARLIVSNIDGVQSEQLRSKLAAKAVSAHRHSKSMNPYLRNLAKSADPKVRSAARSLE